MLFNKPNLCVVLIKPLLQILSIGKNSEGDKIESLTNFG